MAVRVLLMLTAFAVLYGCGQASSPPERQEKQVGVEEAKPKELKEPDAPPATSTSTPLETVTNVRDFGATGNGTSNDTAAFEGAMAEAARVGGVVYVPAPGNYRIAGVTPPNNTHLEVQAGACIVAQLRRGLHDMGQGCRMGTEVADGESDGCSTGHTIVAAAPV